MAENEEGPQEDVVIELGDTFTFISGKYGETKGQVYYRDENLIRVLPEGVANRLYDFPLVDNDFDPELGDVDYFLHDKHKLVGFVNQQDLVAGQYVETFSADGEPAGRYFIKTVDPDADTAVFVDQTDTELPPLEFGYLGIPLDAPFAVLFASADEPPPPAEEEEVTAADALEQQAEQEALAGTMTPADAASATKALPVAETDGEGGAPEGTFAEDGEIDLEFTGQIMVPVTERLQIIPTEQRIYPDVIQKSDALQDFTTMLTTQQQQDMKELRRIRELTETLFALKQELVEYNEDGSYKCTKSTSAKNIGELIKCTNVPLIRPVLDVSKKLYFMEADPEDPDGKSYLLVDTNSREISVTEASESQMTLVETAYLQAREAGLSEEEVEQIVQAALERSAVQEIEEEGIKDPLTVVNIREEWEQIKNFLNPLPSISFTGTTTSTIQFWIQIQAFMARFHRPWSPAENEGADEADEGIWLAKDADSEFFRAQIPDAVKATIRGLVSGDGTSELLTVDRVHFSLNRALKQTARPGGKAILFAAEGGPVRAYLLLPFKFRASVGAARSGFLAEDMANGLASDSNDFKSILKKTGEVSEQLMEDAADVEKTLHADSIIAIGPNGDTIGSIPMADYIKALDLRGYGPADMLRLLAHIGYQSLEWGADMGEELSRKILAYINATKAYIEEQRKTLAETRVDAAPASDSFFEKEELAWLFDQAIPGEPLLAAALTEFKNQSPRLANSDYATLSYLIVKHMDYFLAAAGQNELMIAKERLRTTRANFLNALRIAVKIRDAIRGKAPEPNTCEHVQKLRDIRRLPDDKERLQHLVRFLLRYQGMRDKNWIQCSVCKRDLMCIHEVIELKQFINPREREALRKELLLNFCGPVMGNTYQCRNCGQAMGEIEFDNNVQFDDEGRPMTGYAVLEDQEAAQMTEIDRALGFKSETIATELDFGSEFRNLIYSTIREIALRVGVDPIKTDYEMMIGQVQAVVADLGDRETFVAQQQALAAQMGKKVKLPDYDMVQNRTMVAAAAGYLLIHIQTKIPDYMPSAAIGGCKNPGFRGYPLDEEENVQGQEYLACAVASIMRNAAPWNMTGFQREQLDVKRQKNVFKFINTIVRDAMDKPDVQQLLAAKRKYRQEIYGAGGEARDQVSPFFLPPQRIIRPADAAAAETTVIPEVKGDITVAARSDVWIQAGNQVAAKTASERGELILGSPFSEGTCCYDPLSTPQSFWIQAQLPQLPPRTLRPGALVSRLFVRFEPRAIAEVLADAPEHLFYILFLKVCFAGPRMGLPHEPGLTHMCPHCEFQFPGSADVLEPEAGKAALEDQGVEVNRDTFVELLDMVHKRYAVAKYVLPPQKGAFENMRDVGTLNPPPVDGWAGLIEKTIQQMMSLPPDANSLNIQETLADLSQVGEEAVRSLEQRLSKDALEILGHLVTQSAAALAQICLSYFVVTFNRLVTQLDTDVLLRLNPVLMGELSSIHVSEIKVQVLGKNIYVQSQLRSQVAKAPFARAKLNYCVKQLAQVPRLLERLTATNLPGGERCLRYIVRALIFAPLASLVNPNEIPPGTEAQEKVVIDSSVQIVYNVLRQTLLRYSAERISYSEDQIREILQIRAEKEKADVIKMFDDLSEDERRVELLKKSLRMGDWAVGGSKKITQYDKEQYERERIARARAGISDFVTGGFGPEGPHDAQIALGNEYGLYNFGDGGAGEGRLDGDMMQVREDDF